MSGSSSRSGKAEDDDGYSDDDGNDGMVMVVMKYPFAFSSFNTFQNDSQLSDLFGNCLVQTLIHFHSQIDSVFLGIELLGNCSVCCVLGRLQHYLKSASVKGVDGDFADDAGVMVMTVGDSDER